MNKNLTHRTEDELVRKAGIDVRRQGKSVPRALAALVILLSAISILIGLASLSTSYFRTFFEDDWVNATFYFDRGFWGSIFYRHYSHPVIIPNFLFRIDWVFLDGSGQFRTWITALASGGVSLSLALITVRGVGALPSQARWPVLAGASVVASMGLWLGIDHKLFWVFGLVDHLAALGAAIAGLGLIRLLERRFDQVAFGFALLVAGSMIATFSYGAGVATWVAFSLLLLTAGVPLRLLAAYLLIGVGAAYLATVAIPNFGTGVPVFSWADFSLVGSLQVLLSVIGNAFVNVSKTAGFLSADEGMWIGIAIGALGIVLLGRFLFLGWRSRQSDSAAAALQAVGLFALGGACLIALARTPLFGVEAGMADRYAPTSVLFWMAIVGLETRRLVQRRALRIASERRPANVMVWSSLLLVFAVVLLVTSYRSISHYKEVWQLLSTLAGLVLIVDPSAESPVLQKYVRHHQDAVLQVAERMRRERKDIFRLPLVDLLDEPVDRLIQGAKAPKSCVGLVARDSRWDHPPASFVLHGLARERESCMPVSDVYAVREGRIVGGGISTWPIERSWREQARKSSNVALNLLTGILPRLGLALELPKGGWIAVIRGEPGNIADYSFYGRLGDGSLCRILHGEMAAFNECGSEQSAQGVD